MKAIAIGILGLLPLAQEEATLRVSWAPPSQLDPHRATSHAESRYVGALFEGLVAPGEDGITPSPGMAERWEASADGRVWTFHLREAKWSDGAPVTAQDFLYSWKRALRIETGCEFVPLFRTFRGVGEYLDGLEADAMIAQYEDLKAVQPAILAARLKAQAQRRHAEAFRKRGELEAAKLAESRPDAGEKDLGFEAPDPRTFRLTLVRRSPWLLDLLSLMPFVPVPERAVAAHGEAWVRPSKIVTNGPYLFDGADALGIRLKRNPAYWDAAAAKAPGRVEIAFNSEAVALEKFRDGRLDWVTREQIPTEKAGEQKDLVRFDTWGTFFLRLNCARAPFDRPGVRAAFARAIDRAKLASALSASPAERLVPSGFRGYPEVKGPSFDRAAAVEGLLKESGFDPTKFPKLEILAADAFRFVAAAETLRAQLEATLGVSVKVRTMKFPAYLRALGTGEYQAALGAWMGDYFDPATFLEGWTKDHPQNGTGWSNEEFDRRVAQAADEPDAAARLASLAKAEEILLREGPVVTLYTAGDYYLAAPRVSGLRPNLLGRFPLKHVRLAP
jgi:oligopeptide transport system substrate-binding protein